MAVFQRQFGFITLTALALLVTLDNAALAQHVAAPLHSETGLADLLSNRIIPYGRDHNTPVFADYIPLMAETRVPLRIKMARSEYEPLQIGIYVPFGQPGRSAVQVSVSIDIPYEVGHLHYAPSPDWLEGQDVAGPCLHTWYPERRSPRLPAEDQAAIRSHSRRTQALRQESISGKLRSQPTA